MLLLLCSCPCGCREPNTSASDGTSGMGRTHGKDTTFARAADDMGFVPKEDILEHCKVPYCSLFFVSVQAKGCGCLSVLVRAV